jgi:hypothetical protein
MRVIDLTSFSNYVRIVVLTNKRPNKTIKNCGVK